MDKLLHPLCEGTEITYPLLIQYFGPLFSGQLITDWFIHDSKMISNGPFY